MGILAVASAHAGAGRYHPNHLFIKMKKGAPLVKSELITSSDEIVGNIYLVNTPDADKLQTALQGAEDIEYVEKDYFAGKQAMPKLERLDPFQMQVKSLEALDFASFNDPEVSKLWAFGTNGMDVNGAYASLPNRTPKEIIVAVVDTGVDHNHPDLRDIMWTNHGEIPGNKKDDDGNGYVDDVHGINTLIRDAQGKPTSDTMASHWHGTHVSGTIAATQNNAVGIAGVANNVKIMAVRTVPDDADELDSNIVEAYRYAAKMGAKVINCSFGKSNNEGGMVVRDVINEIGRKYNVLVVASAGNDSMGPFSWHDNDVDPKYPASFDSPNLLVVASTTSSGALSSFSNVGPKTVDVAAPGSNIYSTVKGGGYSMASGTSMAAPNTSGVAAMVLGYSPELKSSDLKSMMTTSVVKAKEYVGRMSSGGRVNLKLALQAAARKLLRK
jgi:subtilisin family serine protease